MNRKIAILIMALIIVTPFIQDVTASKTVFITSDTIIDQENDVKMLNSIKNYIEEISNGELQVIVDNQAPAPGEGWRAIEVTSDISICLAASDAANYLQLGQASANSQKQIVFVNTGNYDLDNNSNYLRRAWDDNYSNSSFAGMRNPGTFLKNAGVYYVQPLKEFPSNGEKGNLNKYDENMNRYIAEKVVDIVNTHFNDTAILSDGFLVYHKIPVSTMADSSKELVASGDKEMTGTYGNYSAPQLLYQTSAYLNGNGLEIPKKYDAPKNPSEVSFLAKNSYSIYEYMEMAGIVKNYMDENGQAPASIKYKGAEISYYDLVYNFAEITQNHTSSKNMGFESEYHFDKVNSSLLLDLFPAILVLFVIFIAYIVIKRIRR